jgi:hypothetical protein
MNLKIKAVCLAALGGMAGLFAPMGVEAAVVGYYTGENCYGNADGPTITAAGHTAVPVATMDAASLAGLDILVLNACYATPSPDVATAVNNGLILVWHSQGVSTSGLPGNPGLVAINSGGADVDLPAGSPVANGPGGPLNNTSLDGGSSSTHGYVASSSLPGGAVVAATQASPANVVTLAYGYGSGGVVYSTIPLGCYLPGGWCSGHPVSPAMQAYFRNVLGWAANGLGAGSVTSCASEGYTGTQPLWCKNICEKGYTGATLEMWIRRWLGRWRDLPYCAVEDEQPPQEPALR